MASSPLAKALSAPQAIPFRSYDSWSNTEEILHSATSSDSFEYSDNNGDSFESGPSSYLQTPPSLLVDLPESPPHIDTHSEHCYRQKKIFLGPISPLSPSGHELHQRLSSLHFSPNEGQEVSHAIDVLTAGVGELAHALDSRELTSVRAIKIYLEQIERWNGYLHALTYVAKRESLLVQARECDRLIRSEGFDRRLLPLCGIPVVVKDNIGTGVELGMPTTAGSLALLGNVPRYDSHVVRRLREAGAIIIGKANMTELASYRSSSVPNGWSAAGGQTVNAYAAHLCPGSSSSGNGVAAAVGFCPLSIGTETDGSITLPAMQSALYALKPTVGLISRSGCVPFAPTFDTPGPMAKDVWSVAVGLDVMAGEDEEDEATWSVERLPRSLRYSDFCTDASFANIRIGVPRANWFALDPWKLQPYHARPSVLKAFNHSLRIMSSLGATVVDHADIPSAVDGSLWSCLHGKRGLVVKADFKEGLGRYLKETSRGNGAGVESLEDIIEFNKTNAVLELPPGCSGQELLEAALDAPSSDSVEYREAKEEMINVAGKNGLDAVLDEYELDAIIAIGHGKHSLANMVGAPIGIVPLGLMEDGEPIGAYFIARRGDEGLLLRIMAAWEKAFGARPLPPIQ